MMSASCLLGAAIAGAATGMAAVGFGVRRRGGEGWLLSSGGFAGAGVSCEKSTRMLAGGGVDLWTGEPFCERNDGCTT